MQSKKTVRAAATGLLVALLAACGGGGDSGDGPAPAGGWTGTTGAGRDLTAVVLPDGNYYLMYASAADPAVVGGAVQGTASITGETFVSSDALDFSAEGAGIRPSAVAATLVPARSFAGTITPTGGTAVSFQAKYETALMIGPPTLQRLAGAYTGTAGFALGVRPATFTVTADGAVSSVINGCAITGTARPRTDTNAYDLAIAFGGAPCALPGLGFTGIAYLRVDNGRLYAVARNAATRQSVIFNGGR